MGPIRQGFYPLKPAGPMPGYVTDAFGRYRISIMVPTVFRHTATTSLNSSSRASFVAFSRPFSWARSNGGRTFPPAGTWMILALLVPASTSSTTCTFESLPHA